MRASTTTTAAIILGGMLAAGGILAFLFPKETVLVRDDTESNLLDVQRVTPVGMRIYGVLSIMFGTALIWYAASPTRRKAAAIEAYVWHLSQELNRRFGERQSYTIEQVNHAARTGRFKTAFIAYAHAMFCARDEFDAHYKPLRLSCTYDGLRRVVGCRYLDGAIDFNGATLVRMARGLYEDETTFSQCAE